MGEPALTADQIRALRRAPLRGLAPDCAHWGEIEIHGPPERPGRICDGTDVAALLGLGLLQAVPLEAPWPVGRHPTIGLVVATHTYTRTKRGEQALSAVMRAEAIRLYLPTSSSRATSMTDA
jgi:hypothetical protein